MDLKNNYSKMLPRLKMNNLNRELLVKAAKRKNYGDNPVVVDATAGLGEDSLLLAAAGFKVILFERNEEIADELQRLMDEVKAEINAVISEEGQDSDNELIISVLQDLAKFYKVSTNYFFENMPELSDKEQLELSNYALKVANNTRKYITVDSTKGLEEVEDKIQARARLRIKNLRLLVS